MYLEYFGLLETPFSIAPDPRYLYMSERHREALAHLLYGLDSDGAFILLSGDVGTGKTTGAGAGEYRPCVTAESYIKCN